MHFLFRVKWKDPVKVELGGNLTLFSMPPPGSGALLAFILNILAKDLKPSKTTDAYKISQDHLTYHRIAEAFKHAYAQRSHLEDPAFAPHVEKV